MILGGLLLAVLAALVDVFILDLMRDTNIGKTLARIPQEEM